MFTFFPGERHPLVDSGFDADRWTLMRRLGDFGLRGTEGIEVHENRSVLVSVCRTGLRLHRGFAYAPDVVLKALISFVTPGIRKQKAREARQLVEGFPVHDYVEPRRRVKKSQRTRPADLPLVRKLCSLHRDFNGLYFEGSLQKIRFRISHRMKRRLGEITLSDDGARPLEIAISSLHLRRDGWKEVEQTLLHEMIHQWQAETGKAVDHGTTFRDRAQEIGIPPSATRSLDLRERAG